MGVVSKEGVTGTRLEGRLPMPLGAICEATLDKKLPGLGSIGQSSHNLPGLGGLWLGERKG